MHRVINQICANNNNRVEIDCESRHDKTQFNIRGSWQADYLIQSGWHQLRLMELLFGDDMLLYSQLQPVKTDSQL